MCGVIRSHHPKRVISLWLFIKKGTTSIVVGEVFDLRKGRQPTLCNE